MTTRSACGRLLAVLLVTSPLAASASDVTLMVPSDPGAKYYVLERSSTVSSVRLLIRRVAPTGVSYSQPDFDCQKHSVGNFFSVNSLEEIRRSKPYVKAIAVSEATVASDLWIQACDLGRSPAEKLAQERWEAWNARFESERHIQQTRHYRRERPLRGSNLTDMEIKEIQSAALALSPGAVVNIGSVVSGCPCEDGASCSAQVWTVIYRPKKSIGVLLSRINRRWTVGPVQQWWLDYEALQTSPQGLSIQDEDALNDRFPRCASTPIVPASDTPRPSLP